MLHESWVRIHRPRIVQQKRLYSPWFPRKFVEKQSFFTESSLGKL